MWRNAAALREQYKCRWRTFATELLQWLPQRGSGDFICNCAGHYQVETREDEAFTCDLTDYRTGARWVKK